MPVVLISSIHRVPWLRQFPHDVPEWGECTFRFDEEADQGYDYLVAIDELHAPIAPTCPRANTIFYAVEPPSIFHYVPQFTRQFGLCLTHHARPGHPHAIPMHPATNWFIGKVPEDAGGPGVMPFEALDALFDEPKDRLISVISSNMAGIPGHRARLTFALRLKDHFKDRIDLFGRGIRTMADKIEGLRGYRFHVALENSRHKDYFTEKLLDPLIAGSFPIYYGCPNIADYFPKNSFSEIDIRDFNGAVATIEAVIDGEFDRVHRSALAEAHRLALYTRNPFAVIADIVARHMRGEFGDTEPTLSYGPELLQRRDPRFRRVHRRQHKLRQARRFFQNIRNR